MNLKTLAVREQLCHKGVVKTGTDLKSASRETLLSVIAEQQTAIAELRRRVEKLEARLSTRGASAGMPGNKPSAKRLQPETKGLRNVVSTALPGGVRNPRGG